MKKTKILLMLLLLCVATTMGCLTHYHYHTFEEKQYEIEFSTSDKHISVESDRPVNIIFIPKYNPNSTVYSKYDVENVISYNVDVQFDDEVFMHINKIGPENVTVTVKAYGETIGEIIAGNNS